MKIKQSHALLGCYKIIKSFKDAKGTFDKDRRYGGEGELSLLLQNSELHPLTPYIKRSNDGTFYDTTAMCMHLIFYHYDLESFTQMLPKKPPIPEYHSCSSELRGKR